MSSGHSALSSHQILFSQYRGPRILNDANAAEAEAKAKADTEAKAQADAEAQAKSEAEKAKADDTEGRISELAKQNKELKAAIKAREDADKKAEEEKLLKKGEHEKLLEQRTSELETERKAKTDYEAKLAKYEADAEKRIADSLKAIADADKQKSAKAMLDGRPLEEQIALLPEVLKLAGTAAPAGFSGATPSSTTTPAKTEVAQMKIRYEELLKKPTPTAQEQRERHDLMVKLQKVWDEEQEKKLAS